MSEDKDQITVTVTMSGLHLRKETLMERLFGPGGILREKIGADPDFERLPEKLSVDGKAIADRNQFVAYCEAQLKGLVPSKGTSNDAYTIDAQLVLNRAGGGPYDANITRLIEVGKTTCLVVDRSGSMSAREGYLLYLLESSLRAKFGDGNPGDLAILLTTFSTTCEIQGRNIAGRNVDELIRNLRSALGTSVPATAERPTATPDECSGEDAVLREQGCAADALQGAGCERTVLFTDLRPECYEPFLGGNVSVENLAR